MPGRPGRLPTEGGCHRARGTVASHPNPAPAPSSAWGRAQGGGAVAPPHAGPVRCAQGPRVQVMSGAPRGAALRLPTSRKDRGAEVACPPFLPSYGPVVGSQSVLRTPGRRPAPVGPSPPPPRPPGGPGYMSRPCQRACAAAPPPAVGTKHGSLCTLVPLSFCRDAI